MTTKEEKEAAKAAEKAEKDAQKAAEKAAKEAEKEAAKADAKKDVDTSVAGIEVGDPQVLRPVDLPLVVTPSKGNSWTPAQEVYAKLLNGYAYRNPEKWAIKKGDLIAKLVEIGKDPSKLALYAGGDSQNLKYSDKRIAE